MTTKEQRKKLQNLETLNIWIFQVTIIETANEKTRIIKRTGIFKIKNESLFIAAQNNTISAIYIEAKIDNTQENGKCRLRCDRNYTIMLVGWVGFMAYQIV